MSFTLDTDRHRLVTTSAGELRNGPDGSFLVYDLLSAQTLAFPNDCLAAAVRFLEGKEGVILEEIEIVEPGASSKPSTSQQQSSSSSSSSSEMQLPAQEIWVKNSGKPSPIDTRAREDLIALIKSEKYGSMLKDKKTTKKMVFEEIAKKLGQKGYSFGDREGWKVCQQKWKNMEAETLRVLACAGPKNTGGGHVKKPEYFEDVFDIVKDSAKACPKSIQDSLPAEKNSTEADEEPGEAENDENSESPFLKVQASSKPKRGKADSDAILIFLKEDAAKREKRDAKLIKMMKSKAKKDAKYKKGLLSVLSQAFGSNTKVRSEKSSSSSSSSSEEEI